MAEKFDEFLEEVEGDIRREKFTDLWRRYGKFVIILVVGALCLSGGDMFWQKHQQTQNQKLSECFVNAQDLIAQGKIDEALTLMRELATSSHPYYPVLARFSEAYLVAKKDHYQGITAYQSIVNNPKADKSLKSLASLFICYLKADHLPNDNSNAKIEELIKEIEPLTNSEQPYDCPWYPLAMEITGALLYKKQEFAKAGEVFLKLVQDSKVPKTIQSRARLMIQNLSTQITN